MSQPDISRPFDILALGRLRSPREVALYLRRAALHVPSVELTRNLLEAIELEALAPDAFVVWLSAVPSPQTIRSGIKQQFSDLIRRTSILAFGRHLRTPEWAEAWNALGGTPGILEILEQLSCSEVEQMCEVIGRSGNLRKDLEDAQRLKVTELLEALFPRLYPETKYKKRDQRPIQEQHVRLVSSCTSNFIRRIFAEDEHPLRSLRNFPYSLIAQYHWPMLRQFVLGVIKNDSKNEEKNTGGLPNAADRFLYLNLSYLLLHIPQLPSKEEGFSASMRFCLIVMRSLVNDQGASLGWRSVMRDLIEPLIKRMKKYRASRNRNLEVVDLAVSYLKSNPSAISKSSYTSEKFTSFLVNCWANDSHGIFERRLTSFFGMHQFEGFAARTSNFEDFIVKVPRELRYDLLRLMLLHTKGFRVDIEDEEGLSSLSQHNWPRSLVMALPVHSAVSLLQKLMRLRPQYDFIAGDGRLWMTEPTILRLPIDVYSNYADPSIILAYLGHDDEQIMATGIEAIESYKDKAVKSRDDMNRSFYAKAASFYAIATGSLDTYEGVILWSKRFLRDMSVLRMIFQHASVCTREGITLLAGVPNRWENLSSTQLQNSVLKGNKIVLHLLGYAVTSLKEQSFYAGDWRDILELFRTVTLARIRASLRIKESLHLSIDDMYNVLWEPTLDLLLQAETIGLQQGHENLNFNSPHGPLGFDSKGLAVDIQPCSSVYRFLDTLARRRDQIWESSRRTLSPATAILEPPWPRGLPIQCFSFLDDAKWKIDVDTAGESAYILARAKAIVFLPKQAIIGEGSIDGETRKAIGNFVDRYQMALRHYIQLGCSSAEQISGARQALHHVLELSKTRMSRQEALRVWKPIFDQVVRKDSCPEFREVDESKTRIIYPLIPANVDALQRTEWNPNDGRPTDIRAREIQMTILDAMLAAPNYLMSHSLTEFRFPQPRTVGVQYDSFWSLKRLEKLGKKSFAVQDASVVASLLFLDSRIPGSPRVLTYAFPSPEQPRFPPIFLDQDFLDDTKDDDEEVALRILEHFADRVSPHLLRTLTEAALHELAQLPKDSSEAPRLQSTAYRLLQLLSSGDRPELAYKGILDVVLGDPESSSWHRSLLTKGFLNMLSASTADQFLQHFVTGTCEKMQEQKKTSTKKSATDTNTTPKTPVIKITTIKFVAQFFEDSVYTSASRAIAMLSELFKRSVHIDVRTAVVASLLSRLRKCTHAHSKELAEQILSTLEFAVPVMGSLTERHVMTEQDWLKCERTEELPEVYEEGDMGTLPPLLASIIKAYISEHNSSADRRRSILDRLLLPALELSAANNARWLSLFQRKHAEEFCEQPFPALPCKPTVSHQLLDGRISELPASILDNFQLYILTNMNPPRPIPAICEMIKADYKFQSSNAGKHFLYLFDNGSAVIQKGNFVLENKLSKNQVSPDPSDTNGIQPAQVEQAVLAHARTLLLHPNPPDPGFGSWILFIKSLQPPTPTSLEQIKTAWPMHGKPCLLKILAIFASIQNDPNYASPAEETRRPLYLPDPYPLYLWTHLTLPTLLSSTPADNIDPQRTFADEIIAEIRTLIRLGLSAFTKLATLKSELYSLTGSPKKRLIVAEMLSDQDQDQDQDQAHQPENDTLGSDTSAQVDTDADRMDLDPDEKGAPALHQLYSSSANELVIRIHIADHILGGFSTDITRGASGSTGLLARLRRLVRGWTLSAVEEIRMTGFRRAKADGLDLNVNDEEWSRFEC